MPRFVLDPNRVNFSIDRSGNEYTLRVLQRAQTIFSNLLSLLPSNYLSQVEGPEYTLELKAVAVELAKIELALEDVDLDRAYTHTRSDFLYSMIGYMVFINNHLPPLDFSDAAFRNFLVALIQIYFQGSVPKSIQDATALFITEGFHVVENFLLTRVGDSSVDISDQFGFQIVIDTNNSFPPDLFNVQSGLRTVLDIIRPAHTLFRIRFVFHDKYDPNGGHGVLDTLKWRLANYYYEDCRSYWDGIKDQDRLGKKTNQFVASEDHSADF